MAAWIGRLRGLAAYPLGTAGLPTE